MAAENLLKICKIISINKLVYYVLLYIVKYNLNLPQALYIY